MHLPERRRARLAALPLCLALFAACGGDDGETTASDDNEAETDAEGAEAGATGDLEGEVIVTGSSTVQPISTAVGEAFKEQNPSMSVVVDGPGTGDGFEAFCAGEADINDASRAIEEDEIALCEEAGVDYTELQIGIDGIAVLTNPANDAVTCLSFADLYALTGPEAEGEVENWSDAQALASELGSTTQLPDAPLDLTGPGEESGTYDSFIELALSDIAEARLEAGSIEEGEEENTRPDYSANPNDNEIIAGIEGSDTSLGWVGFAFAEEAGDQVKVLEVDGGDGCQPATAETIASGEYPLSRPLFIYVNNVSMQERPELRSFVEYYLSDEGIASVEESGYVPLEASVLEETRTALEGA